jgi:hypothetical protein
MVVPSIDTQNHRSALHSQRLNPIQRVFKNILTPQLGVNGHMSPRATSIVDDAIKSGLQLLYGEYGGELILVAVDKAFVIVGNQLLCMVTVIAEVQ